jgi:prephenate dehydrogenase
MKLAIVGPGLIGRSVALAAGRANPATAVVEIDRDQSLDDAEGADIIVLAAPVDVILDVVRKRPDVLRHALTIDTASTKAAIVSEARENGLDRFVGGHPMAGGTASGPAEARADLFDERLWFLVPHGAQPAALHRAVEFVHQLGARPVVMDDDGSEHDRVMAALSHLPQTVVSVLMSVVAEAAGDRLEWAGAGLRDTTRLAHSSGEMWRGILRTNASELRPLLRAVADRLNTLANHLEDERLVREVFADANRYRALL